MHGQRYASPRLDVPRYRRVSLTSLRALALRRAGVDAGGRAAPRRSVGIPRVTRRLADSRPRGTAETRTRRGARSAVELWHRDGLRVLAWTDDEGALSIQGRDRSGRCVVAEEYTYAIVVPAGAVPKVVAALDGHPGDDVLQLLRVHGEAVVSRGELRWLESIGVRADFRTGPAATRALGPGPRH